MTSLMVTSVAVMSLLAASSGQRMPSPAPVPLTQPAAPSPLVGQGERSPYSDIFLVPPMTTAPTQPALAWRDGALAGTSSPRVTTGPCGKVVRDTRAVDPGIKKHVPPGSFAIRTVTPPICHE